MSDPKKPACKKRGRSRMKELGMKRVELYLDGHEDALITAAAAAAGETVAKWIRRQAFHAAQAAARKRVRAGSQS